MSDQIVINFDAQPEDTKQWRKIFKGLHNGQLGAYFQERMEWFGPAVDTKLEAVMEEWPMENFELDSWSNVKEHFEVSFVIGGSDADEFGAALKELFALCPVKNLTVEWFD